MRSLPKTRGSQKCLIYAPHHPLKKSSSLVNNILIFSTNIYIWISSFTDQKLSGVARILHWSRKDADPEIDAYHVNVKEMYPARVLITPTYMHELMH